MIKRILLFVPILLVLAIGVDWAIVQFGFFQEKKTFDLHAGERAYVMILCYPGQKLCDGVGKDKDAIAAFKSRDIWPKDSPDDTLRFKIIPSAQVALLNAITFCLEGDTTADSFVVVLTDRGDAAGFGLIPLDVKGFSAGEIRSAPVWVQMHGTYRPCGWNGEEIFAEFLESVF